MPFRSFLILVCLCQLPILGFAQSDAYALQRILQRYTEAYGGFRDADALSSLSVEGTIEQNGQKFDFLMRKKRPYSLRYRLSNEATRVISGYNGEDAWLRIETGGKVTIKSLEGDEALALREQARFDSPLFRATERSGYDIEFAERTTLNDRSVYVVAVYERGKDIFKYYVDVVTAHVVRVDQVGDDGEVKFQTLYRDFKEVDGFPFAHEIETRANGETTSLARVNVIEVNPGLLSFYFETPSR